MSRGMAAAAIVERSNASLGWPGLSGSISQLMLLAADPHGQWTLSYALGDVES